MFYEPSHPPTLYQLCPAEQKCSHRKSWYSVNAGSQTAHRDPSPRFPALHLCNLPTLPPRSAPDHTRRAVILHKSAPPDR